MDDLAIKVEHLSKKYCKSLKRSMIYGITDVLRNTLGLSSHSEKLRQSEFWSLDDVCFDLKRGETLGIIGPNGAGKTTLLKLLNGIFWPDKGKISLSGRVGALIEVGAGFHPLLTGRENIYVNGAILGMNKREIDKKLEAIVNFADIGDFLDVPVKFYSSGMSVRLGFAIAVHCEPDLLLIDEVLAVGDEGFQNKCLNKIGELRKQGMTTLLVSHNMHMISTFVDKLVLLKKGKSEYFNSVSSGINSYNNLFLMKENPGIEKICSGNDIINFYDVEINKKCFSPGESFLMSLRYRSSEDYDDVVIDTLIIVDSFTRHSFQATNRVYGKNIDLLKGEHILSLKIENINIINSPAKIIVAIYSKRRTGYVFWWRIPVEFNDVPYATGKLFFNVEYDLK